MFPTESHVDELFNIGIYESTTAELAFNTRSAKNEGGYLVVEKYWDRPRTTYQIGQRAITRDELDYIRNFFAARRGQAVSFLWRDYSDHHQDEYQFFTGFSGNTQNRFQLYRYYTDSSGYTYYQSVDRIIPGSVKVYRNGIQLEEGLPFLFPYLNAWRIENGEILFQYPPVSGNYSITFDFYKIVRFDTDKFNARFDAYDPATNNALYFCADLRLTEIRLNSPQYPTLTRQGSPDRKSYRLNFTVVFKDGSEDVYTNLGVNGNILAQTGYPFFGPVLGVFINLFEVGDESYHGVTSFLVVTARETVDGPIKDLELYYLRYGASFGGIVDILNPPPSLPQAAKLAPVAIKDISLVESLV